MKQNLLQLRLKQLKEQHLTLVWYLTADVVPVLTKYKKFM